MTLGNHKMHFGSYNLCPHIYKTNILWAHFLCTTSLSASPALVNLEAAGASCQSARHAHSSEGATRFLEHIDQKRVGWSLKGS